MDVSQIAALFNDDRITKIRNVNFNIGEAFIGLVVPGVLVYEETTFRLRIYDYRQGHLVADRVLDFSPGAPVSFVDLKRTQQFLNTQPTGLGVPPIPPPQVQEEGQAHFIDDLNSGPDIPYCTLTPDRTKFVVVRKEGAYFFSVESLPGTGALKASRLVRINIPGRFVVGADNTGHDILFVYGTEKKTVYRLDHHQLRQHVELHDLPNVRAIVDDSVNRRARAIVFHRNRTSGRLDPFLVTRGARHPSRTFEFAPEVPIYPFYVYNHRDPIKSRIVYATDTAISVSYNGMLYQQSIDANPVHQALEQSFGVPRDSPRQTLAWSLFRSIMMPARFLVNQYVHESEDPTVGYPAHTRVVIIDIDAHRPAANRMKPILPGVHAQEMFTERPECSFLHIPRLDGALSIDYFTHAVPTPAATEYAAKFLWVTRQSDGLFCFNIVPVPYYTLQD